jgi:hypothetical protein
LFFLIARCGNLKLDVFPDDCEDMRDRRRARFATCVFCDRWRESVVRDP